MRRLASKTSSASRLTSDLSEKNKEAVEAGMVAANDTAKTLKKSVDGAQEVNKMVSKISHASVQQAEAISQIRKQWNLFRILCRATRLPPKRVRQRARSSQHRPRS